MNCETPRRAAAISAGDVIPNDIYISLGKKYAFNDFGTYTRHFDARALSRSRSTAIGSTRCALDATARLLGLLASGCLGLMQPEATTEVPPREKDLPFTGYRDQIIRMLGEHQVLVICGETAAAKVRSYRNILFGCGLSRPA